MEYAIVDFDDGTEIVPLIWLEPAMKKCKWPPYTDKTRITEVISKRVTPPNDWESYGVVRIHATTATLDAAIRQLKRAEENSDTVHNIQAEKQETSPAVSTGKKGTTIYAIVDFNDGTEIVPLIWLQPDEKKCKWPPYTDKTMITEAISKRVTPPNDWETYEVVRIRATTATLDAAILQLKWTEENSDMGCNVQAEEQGTTSAVSLGKKDLEDQNNPTLPTSDNQVKRLDDLTKLMNMLMPMVSTVDANVRSLEKKISEIEKDRSKRLETRQNVDTKSNIKKELQLFDKNKSEPFERKLNNLRDENNTKSLLPSSAPNVEKEDHLIKMTEKLLLLLTDTNKSMNSLGKRISIIEENVKKPVVQQNVTTRYEMKPTVKQASHTPLGIKGDSSIVKKKNLPSSDYQTDNTLPKYRFDEWNDPYSDTEEQWSTFTERKSRAVGAESCRWNNSSDFEMIRGFQYFEMIKQKSSPSVYLRTTQKHRNFVCQPVANQPVTALPGIGPVLGGRLASAGYFLARQVLQKFIAMGEDGDAFKAWLHSVCNANSLQSADCYYGLCDWKQNSYKYH